MGLFAKDIKTMDDLFVHQLQVIRYAEKRIVAALPEMIRKSTTPQLRTAFESRLQETKNQVRRLEEAFPSRGTQAQSVDCPAISGLIEHADEVAGEVADKTVLDAAPIAAGHPAERYEIARYGALIAWAKELGRDDCAKLLAETLAEEKAADAKLNAIAEQGVNRAAA